MKTFYWR